MLAFYCAVFLLVIYSILMLLLTLYCLLQLNLFYHYKKYIKQSLDVGKSELLETPLVTIQLPIFNEQYVVQRLVNKILKIDYPKDKLQIQLLDDSTDSTLDISKDLCRKYMTQGFDIEVVHRKDRSGYKAGALENGLKSAKGEFIAIFDADFLPEANFLQSTLPYFENENIGVVQTRWSHINEDFSILTRMQAFQLNVHFIVEQLGREAANVFLQFNGTAGIWRRKTIEKAGGWQAETITEDLDLSYRAQLSGYEIKYLVMTDSPAELPVEMSSLKSQQFRWMKGGAEVARKLLSTILRSEKVSRAQKIHATGHLLNSSVFVIILLTGLTSIPLLALLDQLDINMFFLSFGFIGLLSIIIVYYEANIRFPERANLKKPSIWKFLFMFPIFLSLSMGMSLHNTSAVIQGYLGRKTAFIRTPKFNIQDRSQNWKKNKYLVSGLSGIVFLEFLLGLVFASAFAFGLFKQDYGFIFIHLCFSIGFLSVALFSVKHARR